MPRPLFFFLFAVLILCQPNRLFAGTPVETPDEQDVAKRKMDQEIRDGIQALESENELDRKDARETLMKIGEPALEPLNKTLADLKADELKEVFKALIFDIRRSVAKEKCIESLKEILKPYLDTKEESGKRPGVHALNNLLTEVGRLTKKHDASFQQVFESVESFAERMKEQSYVYDFIKVRASIWMQSESRLEKTMESIRDLESKLDKEKPDANSLARIKDLKAYCEKLKAQIEALKENPVKSR